MIIIKSFRLLEINFIEPLSESKDGNRFILHILCYFIRFSFTFLSKIANTFDVIAALIKLFTIYIISKIFYLNREQYFFNQEVINFLNSHLVIYSFSLFGSSQSIDIIKISNKLLQKILRKGDN